MIAGPAAVVTVTLTSGTIDKVADLIRTPEPKLVQHGVAFSVNEKVFHF
ncbi:hypothetical protein ACVW0P_004293 [Mucilaginibacter sp. UYNi724]